MALVHVPPQPSFATAVATRLAAAELPSFGVMAAALAVILSIRLARALRLRAEIVVTAVCIAFLASLPRPFLFGDPLAYAHRVGATGLFVAIVVALCVAAACRFGRNAGMPGQIGGAAAIVAVGLALFFSGISIADVIQSVLVPLGRFGDSFTALIAIVVVEMLLWMIGVHGPAALAAIVTPLYLTLQLQNTAAFEQHKPLPHIVVTSLFLFIFPGGAGATLPLACMLLFSRTRRLRTLARAAIIPSLFNLNEPLILGLPVTFNPYLAVPFVAAPAVTATITYVAVASNLVPRPAWYVPAIIPSPFATYFATLDPRAIVLVIFNILLAGAIYAPFFIAYDRRERAAAA